jgi:hypothetical protein
VQPARHLHCLGPLKLCLRVTPDRVPLQRHGLTGENESIAGEGGKKGLPPGPRGRVKYPRVRG